MNLVVDQGNTYVKLAFFEGDRLIKFVSANRISPRLLDTMCERVKINDVIYSSVGHDDDSLLSALRMRFPYFIKMSSKLKFPIDIKYKTPETLGVDRIAVAVAAYHYAKGNPSLVIDSGTCITYEFIRANGEYIGGNISPGVRLRLSALHAHTNRLPLVELQDEIHPIGSSTEGAILAGVICGICHEMDGYIESARRESPNVMIFLTGGYSFYFERQLKNDTFAYPNLVLDGLNRILNYNVK